MTTPRLRCRPEAQTGIVAIHGCAQEVRRRQMSALVQKRTFGSAIGMSAKGQKRLMQRSKMNSIALFEGYRDVR